jgi:hypothetical protein
MKQKIHFGASIFNGNAIKLSEKKPIIENLQMDKKVGW